MTLLEAVQAVRTDFSRRSAVAKRHREAQDLIKYQIERRKRAMGSGTESVRGRVRRSVGARRPGNAWALPPRQVDRLLHVPRRIRERST